MLIERDHRRETGRRSGPGGRKSLQRWVFWLFGIALLLAIAAFLFVGDWLVSEDPLQKAGAIAVLSGGMPPRALEAARLYRQGYAPKVWLSHSDEPGQSLLGLGIAYTGEEQYDKQILIREGVPPTAIEILEPPIRNTADEINAISDALAPGPTGTVIIVTSKVHTRRARILWRRLGKPGAHAVIRGVSDDPFRPKHWWANTTDALDVVREALGILNAWAGLPVHAAQ